MAILVGWCGKGLFPLLMAQEPARPSVSSTARTSPAGSRPNDKALFSVEDGEIVGRTQGNLKKNEFLVTEKPYRDFVLKAKVKYKNGNSGIQFRSKRAADGAVSGPQADVADGYWGLLYEERGRGILERYPEDKAKELVKHNDWNEFVITAKGKHVTIDFNGTRIIDRTDPIRRRGHHRPSGPRRPAHGGPLQGHRDHGTGEPGGVQGADRSRIVPGILKWSGQKTDN